MKCIYLVRHAKSDWDAEYDEDHERPLAERGRLAATRLGKLLTNTNSVPELIFASTAVRASDTANLVKEAGGWRDTQVYPRRDLYGAGVDTILSLTHELPDNLSSVMFFGHEPGWSHAVSALSGGSLVRMPTACLAQIDFEVETWPGCRLGHGVLTRLIPPKGVD